MVAELELKDVTFYEVSSKLKEDVQPPDSPSEVEIDLTWGVRLRHDRNEFGVRLKVLVDNAMGETTVDLAAEYRSPSALNLKRETVKEFVNNVALMQLFPFIREAVMSTTSRLQGRAVVLPVFQRGQLVLELGEGPDISVTNE